MKFEPVDDGDGGSVPIWGHCSHSFILLGHHTQRGNATVVYLMTCQSCPTVRMVEYHPDNQTIGFSETAFDTEAQDDDDE